MLGGEYRHTADEKGRVSIPAKFRNELGNVFVVSKGLGDAEEKCLYLFPLSEWKTIEDKARALPITNKNARDFKRYFIGGASECELDKQGRLMIPTYLREFAGIKKDVIFLGVGGWAEAWDADMLNDYRDPDKEGYVDISQRMEDLGI